MSAERGVTTRVEREHRWFEYGRWFYGFGSSMDPHVCNDPRETKDIRCEWRERTVTETPWSDWRVLLPAADDALARAAQEQLDALARGDWEAADAAGRRLTPPTTTGESA